jgi:signal transduction histidine kinase
VTRSRGAAFGALDQELLQEIADRTSLAVDNARVFQTERRAKQQLELFARASALLSSTLDYERTLHQVIDLALPTLGDFGLFEVVQADGSVRRIARAPGDPERQAKLDQMRWEQSNLGALDLGYADFHPDIGAAWLRENASSYQVRIMTELGVNSMIRVPLTYEDRRLGALTLFHGPSGRQHSAADIVVAEELARRCAAALENARLFRAVERAVGVRDDFLSIAGHELKTPVAALQLQIQGLMRQLGRGAVDGPMLEERLGRAGKQIGRLERLISELLDVSRITGGRLRLHPEELELVALCHEVADRFRDELGHAGCQLTFSGAPQVQGSWDRLRIEQVVANLIANAIKYGPSKPIEVGIDPRPREVALIVRDHGIGIAPPDRERIFGRFERAVSERHYGGLGLGLWIARQIVDAMGGAISCDSEMGTGTTFTVTLPR